VKENIMSFEADYNALRTRTTDRIIEVVLSAAHSTKNQSNISAIDAGMLILMDRLDGAAYNALWAEIEDAGYTAGDEPTEKDDRWAILIREH